MGYAPAAVIEGPDRVPLPYGVFSVVSIAENATERWENGVQWEALSCDPVAVVVGDCDAPEGFPKQFPDDGPGTGEAQAFTVYGTAKCTPTGGDINKQNDLARTTLLNREEQAVEARLWQYMAQVDGAETLTAAGALNGLAQLEAWIGANYGSKGVIHASRFAATVLAVEGLIEASGGQMLTKLGTPVIVGSGYPGTGPGTLSDADADPQTPDTWSYAAPTAGDQFIAASPALFGYRSEIFTGSNTPGDLLDRGRNDLYGIAERNYLLGMDPCGVAFVQIDLGV